MKRINCLVLLSLLICVCFFITGCIAEWNDKPINTISTSSRPKQEYAFTDGKYLYINDLSDSTGIFVNNHIASIQWRLKDSLWYLEDENELQESYMYVFLEIYCPDLISHPEISLDGNYSNSISMRCEFYLFDSGSLNLTYVFNDYESDEDVFERIIYIYNDEIFVGKVLYYTSNTVVSEEWLIDFFNTNLSVVEINY